MSIEFMHVGVPVTTKKENMVYNKELKVWITNPEDYDFKTEYLKYEENTTFPEIMHKNPHIAYKVKEANKFIKESDKIIFGPQEIAPNINITFIIRDDTIFELYEDKN